MWPPEAQSYLKVCGSAIPQNSKRASEGGPFGYHLGETLHLWQPRAELGQELWGTKAQPHLPPHSRAGCVPVSSVLREILTCHCCLGPWKQPGWLLRWAGSSFQLSPSGPTRCRHWGLSTLFCENALQPFLGPHWGMLLHHLNWNKRKGCSDCFSLSRAPQSQGSV